MKAILAKSSGFCMGVKRAVDTAKTVYGEGVYVLGEIIHNETVIKQIEDLGTTFIDDIDQIQSGTLIIRSHGVGKEILQRLERKNVKVINCTCPYVMKIQKIIEEHYEKGYQIYITGEKNHPEVVGLNGWCDNTAIIVDENFEQIEFKNGQKVCLVSQTTYSVEKFAKILEYFKKNLLNSLAFFQTICYTTRERQEEADTLSKTCDAMVVVGGKNSSNTKKLMRICQENCENVYFISNPDQLDYKKIRNYKMVGIVAGASTPNEQSMEVFTNMSNTENNVMEEALNAIDEQKFRRGQKVTATISAANDDGLALYLVNTKKEIVLSKDEIDCENYDKADYAAKVGEEIEVMIVGLNPVVLSEKAIRALKEEEEIVAKIADGEIFNVTVTGFNKGGLVAKLGSYDVFVPSSQIRIGFVKDLEKYVGKNLRLKAEKVENKGRRKQIVGSQRVILEAEKAARDAEREAKEAAFFESINEGDVVTGKVVRFANFGAFVEVNGFDCLCHIDEISWVRVDPKSVLELNKEYEFRIQKRDVENKKVSLSYKALQPKPWELAADKYAIGDVVKGKVVRIVPFGAFVEIEKGIDGLVHVSQISHEWLENPTSVLTENQEVDVKILDLDVEKEKMTLSIKALTPAPEGVQKPRREKKEVAEGEEKVERKPRRERKVDVNDDEPREWTEGGLGGISLGDLINNKKD